MNEYLWIAILSLTPISELRGAIPTGFALGLNNTKVILISILFNILVIPIVYLFLEFIHKHLIKIEIYAKYFNKFLISKRKILDKYKSSNTEFISLMLFVGIPLPFTGAYTGTLLAWFFNMNIKKMILSITCGIIISALIISLLTYGGIVGFKTFII